MFRIIMLLILLFLGIPQSFALSVTKITGETDVAVSL